MENTEPKKPRKKRGCLTTFIGFILVVAVIIGGLLMYLKMQQPDAVVYTEEDVTAFYTKLGIEEGAYAFSIIELMEGNVTAEGTRDVDDTFTSEEITGGLQNASSYVAYTDAASMTAASDNPFFLNVYAAEDVSDVTKYSTATIFGDLSFRFTGPDEMEFMASPTEGFRRIYDYAPDLKSYEAAIDRVIGATLYIKLNMTYSNNTLYLDATEVNLNGIPVPMALIDRYEDDFASRLSRALNQLEGLEIEIMTIDADGFRFKGTVPATIKNEIKF